MATARSTYVAIAGLVALLVGCGGFSHACSRDSDCPPLSYCNLVLAACFGSPGPPAVPVILSVDAGTGPSQLLIAGTAPAQSTVSIFTDSSCRAAPLVSGEATASGDGGVFSLQATAPTSGTLYASAVEASVESACSAGFSY